jgi:hypothetical protein
MRHMSEQTEHVNGTAPAPVDEPCTDCASKSEKLLAILAVGFAVFITVMAIDMFTGGKVSGYVRQAQEQATE